MIKYYLQNYSKVLQLQYCNNEFKTDRIWDIWILQSALWSVLLKIGVFSSGNVAVKKVWPVWNS